MELKKNNTVLDAALKAKSDGLLELQKEASFQANICLSNILHNKHSHVDVDDTPCHEAATKF